MEEIQMKQMSALGKSMYPITSHAKNPLCEVHPWKRLLGSVKREYAKQLVRSSVWTRKSWTCAHTSTSDTGLKEMWVQRESSYSWERDIERYTNREKSSRGMGKARPMLEALLAFALWVTSRREQVQDSYSWARALLPHKPWGVAVSMT